MKTRTVSYLDLDDLDLTHCVVGPDLVARLDGSVTLYRREGRSVAPLGVFDGPASAFAALDALDAPGPDDPDGSCTRRMTASLSPSPSSRPRRISARATRP